jgi:hypothetical protein
MRLRKPRIDLEGYQNDFGVVTRTVRANHWFIRCFSCGEEHEQQGAKIKQNREPRECKNFKPHNYSGMSTNELYIRRKYNISLQEFNDLLELQGGGCAICGMSEEPDGRRLSIDHCHDTGDVRGILCNGCNNGIGSFGDKIEPMMKAIEYLKNPPFNISRAR